MMENYLKVNIFSTGAGRALSLYIRNAFKIYYYPVGINNVIRDPRSCKLGALHRCWTLGRLNNTALSGHQ
jgi:hypothetical protein